MNGEVSITYWHGALFDITDIYDNTTHMDSCRQVSFHKLVPIKLFDKIPSEITISISFNKYISSLCD